MKRAKKRQIKLFGQRCTAFVEALMSMPNADTDVDFERGNAVDQLLQFIRDARPTTVSLDLKKLKDEGRA